MVVFSKEYEMLNAGAHRKPPARIGVPAICRHRAFWLPRNLKYSTGDAWHSIDWSRYEAHRSAWVLIVEIFLANLCSTLIRDEKHRVSHLSSSQFDPKTQKFQIKLLQHIATFSTSGELIDLEGLTETRKIRYEQFSIKAYFAGSRVQFRAELHSEFFSFTTIADLDRNGSREENAEERAIAEKFKKIEKCADRRWHQNRLSTNDANSANIAYDDAIKSDRQSLKPTSDYLFDEHWLRLESEVVKVALDCSPPKKLIEKLELIKKMGKAHELSVDSSIGDCIADFRSVVLGTKLVDTISGPESESSFQIEPPFKNLTRLPLGRLANHQLDSRTAVEEIDALLPFLEGVEELENGKIKQGNPEYVGSLVLSKRAIYISSLGAGGRNRENKNPIRFLVISKTLNRWQIGRLIERVNYLGTLRLAALKDLDHLEKANEVLREIELRLNALNTKFDVGEQGENQKQEVERLREAVKNADVIGTENDSSRCHGGLQYRIERSRYYTKTFEHLVKGLRIARIEGFQRYDDFVHRRIGATWDFIDRLGVRIDRINGRFDSITMESQLRSTVNLLKIAEVAAFCAATYYIGTIVLHLFPKDQQDVAVFVLISYLLGAIMYTITIHRIHYRLHAKFGERYSEFAKRNLDTPFPFRRSKILQRILSLPEIIAPKKQKKLLASREQNSD